ncbi:MAG: hypothetical protein HQM14_17320 [SAR324 cluster bacterium]|nr:hypothetical protein [SAR324 cluster bacterium]
MTILAIIGHLVLNFLLGWSLLSLKPKERNWGEHLVSALALGIYTETIFVATMMFLGLGLKTAIMITASVLTGLTFLTWKRGHLRFPSLVIEKPKWYEWLLLLTVGEKIAFIGWQIFRMDLHFDDATNHWAGRAHSLFGGINWSFDPDSPLFLGSHIAFKNYPLGTIMWSTITAVMNGEWNDVIARIEGLVFFCLIVATVWSAVWRFSQSRWFAAFAAFTVSALPLHVWHAASGYSDTAVTTFGVLALAVLLRKEWFLAGIMVAGAAWSKNDGLALFAPSIFVGVGLWQFSWQDIIKIRWFEKQKWQNIGCCFLGIATLAPWYLYKQWHSLSLSEHMDFTWHPDAPNLFWDYVMMGPTNSILWICLFPVMVVASFVLHQREAGRAVFGVFWTTFAVIIYVFFFTSAYEWLKIQTTVHRTMLQFSGIAVIASSYGIWSLLNMKEFTQNKKTLPPRTQST